MFVKGENGGIFLAELWAFTGPMDIWGGIIKTTCFGAAIGMIAVLVELVRLVPITIQGIGVREAAYAYCFQIMGHAPENGFVVGAVAYALASLAVILIGVIGYILPRR